MATYQSTFTGAQVDAGITKANSAQQPPAEGPFVDGDKTKLDGIEDGATADQTGAEIKIAYEAQANTNAFTDAQKSKLDGIEAGADVTDTANVTAAGALMDSEVTNLAAVKAFDPTDYATAAQGGLADTAVQPGDDANTLGSGAATDGYVLTADGVGGSAWEASSGADDYIRTRAGSIQDLFNMADTWNEGSTTFTAIKMNVTDTASDASSLLMDLQVGGSSKFKIDKNGYLYGPNAEFRLNTFSTNSFSVFIGSARRFSVRADNVRLALLPLAFIGNVDANVTPDLYVHRDAANTLAQRNSTNAQTFNLYNTYTDASNYERGFMKWTGNELRIGTEAAGTGSLRSIGLYIGNTRYQIIGSNFNQFDKALFMNGANIATDTSTGFKIGTGTTQKLGFWNATPVVQPGAVADATDAATVITQLNALLAHMRTIGLIAT